MGGVRILASSHVRRRWRGLLSLGVLTGVVGAAVLGSLTAASRTSTAYDRLARAVALDDVRVQVVGRAHGPAIASLPSVEEAWIADMVIARPDGPEVTYILMTAGPPRPAGVYRPIIVQGREPSPSDPTEVAISESFQVLSGLEVGFESGVKLITREEFGRFDVGFGEPDGPALRIKVVGVARIPGNTSTDIVVGTPALAASLPDEAVVGQAVFIRLKAGETTESFSAELEAISDRFDSENLPGGQPPYRIFDPFEDRAAVSTSANTVSAGLLVFALIAALAGAFVLAQAFARHHAVHAADQLIEASLGMTRRQSIVGRALPAVITAATGALIGTTGAIVSSAWSPAGVIARFEPSPGIQVNIGLLAVAALALVVGVLLLDGVAAMLAVRRARAEERARPSPLANLVSSIGGRESVVIGLRHAFEAGSGRGRVPVRSALAAVVVGIAGFVAVAAFQSSIDRLTSTPSRYGWNADMLVSDLSPETAATLEADPRIEALAEVRATSVQLRDGSLVAAYAFTQRKGSIEWTMLDGRMPENENEIALGARVADRLGLSVPDRITIGRDPAVSLTVVGIGISPAPQQTLFGDTIALSRGTLDRIASQGTFTEGYLRVAPGVPVQDLHGELSGELEISSVEAPSEVSNLDQLGLLPGLLGVFFGLLALGATANVLLVGVRRRRKEFAVLRTLGFTAPQVRSTIRTTGLTTMAVGSIFGIPVGIAAGRSVWRLVAERTFVGADVSLPVVWLAPVAPAALLVAIVLTAFPAARAARIQPAVALRAE